MNLLPGDVIFYPNDGKWNHDIIAWMQKIGKETGDCKDTLFTHVAMISGDTDLLMEMRWPHPRFRYMADDVRPKVIMRPTCEDKYKIRAIQWCYLNIDKHYYPSDYIMGWLNIKQVWRICSAWVNRAYTEAGFPLVTGDKLVSPCELICSNKLTEVPES